MLKNEIGSDTEYKDSNEMYSGSEDEEITKTPNSKKEKAKNEKSEAEVDEDEYEVSVGGTIKRIKIQDHAQRMQRMNRISRQIIVINVTIKTLEEQKYNVLFEMMDSKGEEVSEFVQELAEIDEAIRNLKDGKN